MMNSIPSLTSCSFPAARTNRVGLRICAIFVLIMTLFLIHRVLSPSSRPVPRRQEQQIVSIDPGPRGNEPSSLFPQHPVFRREHQCSSFRRPRNVPLETIPTPWLHLFGGRANGRSSLPV